MTVEIEQQNNNEMPGLKRMESDRSHHGATQLAPLPTQEIARRKTVEQEQYPRRRTSQVSLTSFTSDGSYSSDPGKISEVGNLRFLNDVDMPNGESSILGRGAFAMVRLARRRTHQRSASMVSGLSNTSHDTSIHAYHHQKRRAKSYSNGIGNGQQHTSSLESSGSDRDENGTLVAVKIFEKSLLEKCRTVERDTSSGGMEVHTALENVEREIAVMKMIQHPNLVSLYEVIDTGSNRLYMVLEYLPLGEIMTNIVGSGVYKRRPVRNGEKELKGVTKDGYFDEEHAALYFVDIMHGLAHLHKNHIVHRDLKPENILLDSRGFAKISDFGVAHLFEDEMQTGGRSSLTNSRIQQTQCTDRCDPEATYLSRKQSDSAMEMESMSELGKLTKTEGTWCFWSPEMCAEDSLVFSGYACDIWAAGICLFTFATGELPFYTEIPLLLFDTIAEANVMLDKYKLSKDLKDILKKVLAKDPSSRAGVGDCLKHPFCQQARLQRIRELGNDVENQEEVVVNKEDMKRAFSQTKKGTLRGLASTVSKRILYLKSRLSNTESQASMRLSTGDVTAAERHTAKKKRVSAFSFFSKSKMTMSMDDDQEDNGGGSSSGDKRTGFMAKIWKSTGQIGR